MFKQQAMRYEDFIIVQFRFLLALETRYSEQRGLLCTLQKTRKYIKHKLSGVDKTARMPS